MPKTTLSQEVSGDRQKVTAQADTTPLTLSRLYKQWRTFAMHSNLSTAERAGFSCACRGVSAHADTRELQRCR
ncbi:MAG: hypothetical protein ACJ8AG_07715 [Ktedonobacteraceae bacterium]